MVDNFLGFDDSCSEDSDFDGEALSSPTATFRVS